MATYLFIDFIPLDEIYLCFFPNVNKMRTMSDLLFNIKKPLGSPGSRGSLGAFLSNRKGHKANPVAGREQCACSTKRNASTRRVLMCVCV